jgi:hypothetical protein
MTSVETCRAHNAFLYICPSVRPSIPMIHFHNRWRNFHEIWYGRNFITGHTRNVIFYFLQSSIPTWRSRELVKQLTVGSYNEDSNKTSKSTQLVKYKTRTRCQHKPTRSFFNQHSIPQTSAHESTAPDITNRHSAVSCRFAMLKGENANTWV